LKKGHLLRFPHPSSLQRMQKIRLTPQGSGALHLSIFEQSSIVVIPASGRESSNSRRINTIDGQTDISKPDLVFLGT